MKPNNFLLPILLAGVLMTSCDDFFDTAPKDALSPATFWKLKATLKRLRWLAMKIGSARLPAPRRCSLPIACPTFATASQVRAVTSMWVTVRLHVLAQ